MISFDEALTLIADCAHPLGTETLPLAAAGGLFLAAPVIAKVDAPPCDVSAMDGFAVRDCDLPRVRLVGASYPGEGHHSELASGQCVRIFTGAPVPMGADRVVVQEVMHVAGTDVVLVGQVGEARHIRRRGSDFTVGQALLLKGRQLDPRALIAAAGADVADIDTWRRPVAIVLSTGDELVEPGKARSVPGSIPESVSLGVAALIERYGGLCIERRRVRDNVVSLRSEAARALEHADLVVITGGASVGERDFAKPAVEALDLELVFSKVAMKPGMPVWFGSVRGRRVVGLPGNPTSALVTARLLLAPLVRGMAGGDPHAAILWRSAPLANALDGCGDRETFVRGRWRGSGVEELRNQDSGAQYALADAELLIRRRPGAAAASAGQQVDVIDF